ncbi:MAG: hypothetical protein ACRBBK_11580 [Paracoccaceae bacterium]
MNLIRFKAHGHLRVDLGEGISFHVGRSFAQGLGEETVVGLLAKSYLANKDPSDTDIHSGMRFASTRTSHGFIKQTLLGKDAINGRPMSAHHYFRDLVYCDSRVSPSFWLPNWSSRMDHCPIWRQTKTQRFRRRMRLTVQWMTSLQQSNAFESLTRETNKIDRIGYDIKTLLANLSNFINPSYYLQKRTATIRLQI